MSTQDLNSSKLSKIIGIIYIVTSLLSMFCQIFIFYVFKKDKKLLENTAHKLILFLSILEFTQQIPHFSGGISSIMEKSIPTILERFFGSLLQASFMISFLTTLYLTLNRFYIFYKTIIIHFINQLLVQKIATCITVSLSLSLFITYLFHDYGLNYDYISCTWNYIMDEDEPIPIYEFEYIFVLTILSISFIFYISIFLKIIYERNRNDSTSKISFKSTDIRTLTHIITIYLFSVILEMLWWYNVDWFGNPILADSFLNYAWLLYSGMNSFINIIFIR
uniref:7TM_GPCR_Srx domain-containing protein n=1 Tax=Strongyloides papillosus TaxID=174720 RepID=A0A0N5BU36_STREA